MPITNKLSSSELTIVITIVISFLLQGIIAGTWLAIVPNFQKHIFASYSVLSLCFCIIRLGGFLAVFFSSFWLTRYKPRKVAFICLVVYSILILVLLILPFNFSTFVSLFFFGAFGSTLGASNNTIASAFENLKRKHILSKAHACFSLGMLVSMLIAMYSGVLSGTISPKYYLGGLSIVVIIAMLFVLYFMGAQQVSSVIQTQAKLSLRTIFSKKKVITLTIISIFSFMVEGGINNWLVLYFIQVKHMLYEQSVNFLVIYFLFLVIASSTGDFLARKIGYKGLIIGSSFFCLIGFIILLVPYIPVYPSLLVFGCMILGLGVANIAPSLFHLSANINKEYSSVYIAKIIGIGFSGFLLSPIIIGQLINLFSLKYALLILPIYEIVVFSLSFLLSDLRTRSFIIIQIRRLL